MASLEGRTWRNTLAGPALRARRPGRYRVYLPDPLVGRRFRFEGEVAAEVAEAEADLVRLDHPAGALTGGAGLARLLLHLEAVASSRIEGIVIGGRRLLRAAAARESGESLRDDTAVEVLGNSDALAWGAAAVGPGDRIGVDALLETHRRPAAGTPLEEHGGSLRRVQNWIGGSHDDPCSADFVPPPPDLVPGLLADLCEFCSGDGLPALAQAAIAHAQFETIHPFVDGNGRTGRVLTQMVLRRRGYAGRMLPPISLVLAGHTRDYLRGLVGFRHIGTPDSEAAHRGMNDWSEFFAAAGRQAVQEARAFEARIRDLVESWHSRLGPARRDSAVHRLVEALPAAPVLTVTSAASLLGRSFQATSSAIERLVAAGILTQVRAGRRNRAFESPELIHAFTDLERQIASRAGDTRREPLSRPVPDRPGA